MTPASWVKLVYTLACIDLIVTQVAIAFYSDTRSVTIFLSIASIMTFVWLCFASCHVTKWLKLGMLLLSLALLLMRVMLAIIYLIHGEWTLLLLYTWGMFKAGALLLESIYTPVTQKKVTFIQ
jgi:hypothetical protein